jgi:hypothetical protein
MTLLIAHHHLDPALFAAKTTSLFDLYNITTTRTQVPLLMTTTSLPKVDSTFHMHQQTPKYPMLEGNLH